MNIALVKTNKEIVITNSLPDFFKEKLIGKKEFVCAWTKQDDVFRTGTFDLKKRKKWVTAEGVLKKASKKRKKRQIAQWVFNTYCVAFDLDKQDYRRITYNTIEYLEVDKIKYLVKVKVLDSDRRAMELKPINKIKSN